MMDHSLNTGDATGKRQNLRSHRFCHSLNSEMQGKLLAGPEYCTYVVDRFDMLSKPSVVVLTLLLSTGCCSDDWKKQKAMSI